MTAGTEQTRCIVRICSTCRKIFSATKFAKFTAGEVRYYRSECVKCYICQHVSNLDVIKTRWPKTM